MHTFLCVYKSLVDKLRSLPVNSPESVIIDIDNQLKEIWSSLCDDDKNEAESYWRSSLNHLPIASDSSHDLN